jgi:hypothetical protein
MVPAKRCPLVPAQNAIQQFSLGFFRVSQCIVKLFQAPSNPWRHHQIEKSLFK